MRAETRKKNTALFDLSWEHACWVTQIFHYSPCICKWPQKYCKYWLGSFKQILTSRWIHKCGLYERGKLAAFSKTMSFIRHNEVLISCNKENHFSFTFPIYAAYISELYTIGLTAPCCCLISATLPWLGCIWTTQRSRTTQRPLG